MSGGFAQPINIERVYLEHDGGTKDYSIFLMSCGGRRIVAFSWGKIGHHNASELHLVSDVVALSIIDKKIEAKKKRGYTYISQPTREANSRESLKTIIGENVFAKLDLGTLDCDGLTAL